MERWWDLQTLAKSGNFNNQNILFLPASFPKWDRTYSEEAWLFIFTSYHIYVLSRQQYALVHSYSVTLNARQIHSFFNYLSQNFWKSCNLWDCFWFALQNRQKYFFVKIFFVRTRNCKLMNHKNNWKKVPPTAQRCVLPVSFPVDLLLWQ